MSSALERLGRFAARRPTPDARRPWIVIGSWVAIGFLVITSAAAFGRDLEDPFEPPGLDSHRATELLAQAGSAEVGLGADVVLTSGGQACEWGRRTDEVPGSSAPGARRRMVLRG